MYNINRICIETMAMSFGTMSVIFEFTSPIMSSTSEFINSLMSSTSEVINPIMSFTSEVINPIMSSTSEAINPTMGSTSEFTSLTRSSIISETPGSPLSIITFKTNIFTSSIITIGFTESNNVMSSISTTSLTSSISDSMHSIIYSTADGEFYS